MRKLVSIAQKLLSKTAYLAVAASAFAGFVVVSTELVTLQQEIPSLESIVGNPARDPASAAETLQDEAVLYGDDARSSKKKLAQKSSKASKSQGEQSSDDDKASPFSTTLSPQQSSNASSEFRAGPSPATNTTPRSQTEAAKNSSSDSLTIFSGTGALLGPSLPQTETAADTGTPSVGSGAPAIAQPVFSGLESVTEVGIFSVKLNWTSEDGVASYRIYTVAAGVATLFATVPAPASSEVVATLLAGTSYTFRVRKVSATNEEDDNEDDITITTDVDSPTFTASSTPASLALKGGDSVNLSWSATDPFFAGTPITLSYSLNNGSTWTSIATNQVASGTYSWTLPSANTTQALVRITATNSFGKTTLVTSAAAFTIDSAVPVIQAASFKINGSATPLKTSNVNVAVEFTATDATAAVDRFCIRYNDNSVPGDSDPCWVNVAILGLTAATTLNVTLAQNYFFQTGYALGTYDCYLWVKDAAGNRSVLTEVVGQDLVTIEYDPGTPPTISSFQVTGVDNPANPPASAELQIAANQDVYVRWRVTDDTAIPAGGIGLFYFDPADSTWKAVPGATALSNSANGGCTADDPLTALVETGCFLWSGGSPSNDPYQVRLLVRDSDTQTQQSTSAPINTGVFRVIAGNTDPGVNGSARSAVLFPTGAGEVGHSNQFVVTPEGYVYIRDNRGLLRISPTDGALKILIPDTGVDSSPGSAASSTTVSNIIGLTLDQQGRVLMRTPIGIMRFNGSETDPVITRIIGGGGSTASGLAPLATWINGESWNGMTTLVALPNGRIYFDDNNQLRYYDPITDTIELVALAGTGMHGESGRDTGPCWKINLGIGFDAITSDLVSIFSSMAACPGSTTMPIARFNPSTLQSLGDGQTPTNFPIPDYSYITKFYTGVNGKLYAFNFAMVGKFWEYNPTTNTMEAILGGAGNGYCPDGALASTCQVTPQSMFVDKFGKVYFLESGMIRIVQDDGTIRTLYGAWSADGDGGSALSARMLNVLSLGQANDRSIQLMQTNTNVIREFTSGGTIQRIIGTGNSGEFAVGDAAASSPFNGLGAFGYPASLAVDPVSKDIYLNGPEHRIYRFDRASGLWGNSVIGGGATDIFNADGVEGNNILTSWFFTKPLYFGNGLLVVSSFVHYGVPGDRMVIKAHDVTDNFKQYHVAGNTDLSVDPARTLCTNGAATNSCYMDRFVPAYNSMAYDPVDEKFIFAKHLGMYISKSDSTVQLLTGFGAENAMTYRRISGTPDQEIIYWCNHNGILKRDINSGSETVLLHSVLGITCGPGNMVWNDTDKKLIFSFVQNGLYGVAELYDP